MPGMIDGRPIRKADLEILGEPRTVRLCGTYRAETFEAPMEVWIMALVAVLTADQKQQFFDKLKHVMGTGDYRRIKRAQVVADIPMPNLEA